jgi:aspartate 1-decarboxylase
MISIISLIFAEAMQIQVLKSKIHGVKVTEANLDYIGSVTIDEDLMDAANVIENEKVLIVDKDNGSRLETYIIKGKRGSGVICLNGAAARLVEEGDELIIMSFALMDFDTAKKHVPTVIFPDKNTNRLK